MLAATLVDIGAQYVSVSGWLTIGSVSGSVAAIVLVTGVAPAGAAGGAACWQALSASETDPNPS